MIHGHQVLIKAKLLVIPQDFMALLAYEEPEKSPMFRLLSPDHRQDVAGCLNRAMLGILTI